MAEPSGASAAMDGSYVAPAPFAYAPVVYSAYPPYGAAPSTAPPAMAPPSMPPPSGVADTTSAAEAGNTASKGSTGGSSTAAITPGFYDSAQNWIPKYIGYLKSYNASQGYGFISCSETFQIHNQDVFIHRAQVEERGGLESGGAPQVGQWVEFVFKSNERGQPQARNVVWLEGKIDPSKMEQTNSQGQGDLNDSAVSLSPSSKTSTSKGGSRGVFQDRSSSPKRNPSQNAEQSQDEDSNADSNAVYQGSLKSFSQNSGYGFIHCPDLWERYKRDVYVHKTEMPGDYRTGLTCDFQFILNPKGQPQAKNVVWH